MDRNTHFHSRRSRATLRIVNPVDKDTIVPNPWKCGVCGADVYGPYGASATKCPTCGELVRVQAPRQAAEKAMDKFDGARDTKSATALRALLLLLCISCPVTMCYMHTGSEAPTAPDIQRTRPVPAAETPRLISPAQREEIERLNRQLIAEIAEAERLLRIADADMFNHAKYDALSDQVAKLGPLRERIRQLGGTPAR